MGSRNRSAAGRASSAAALVLAASLALLSCGGGEDSTSTAQRSRDADVAVLARRAFGPNPEASSGRIDGRITIAVRGARGFGEPVELAMSGPFSARSDSALPDYAIDLSIDDQGVGLSSVGGRSFVSLGPSGYELPARVRRRLARSAANGHNGLTRMLEQFGIAPWRWETDKRFGATERVDGVQTARVDTGVDVDRFLRDANTLGGVLASLGVARANGIPARIPATARRILVDSVRAARGASWIATSDDVMRKAGLTIDFTIAPARRAQLGGISSAKVVAELLVSDVGRRRTFEPPQTLEPFSSLQAAFDALAEDARR